MAYCSAGCRIEGEGSELTWTHRVPCLRSEGESIVFTPSPGSRPGKLKNIRCPYCDASTHIALDSCWDFNKKFPPRQNTTNRTPIFLTMLIPRSNRMHEDSKKGARFSGYDRPRATRGKIPKVTAETEVEFCQLVVMLLVEETRVIPTTHPIVTTLTPHLSIHAKSLVVVRTTGMRQGRRSMINS